MISESQDLDWLASWYTQRCDGSWEHTYGVRISTLDNPGWKLEIDLEETELQAKEFVPIELDRSPADWIHCKVEKLKFKGRGGSKNLGELLAVFRNWVEN